MRKVSNFLIVQSQLANMDFRLLRAAKELAKTRKVDTLRFIVFIGQYTLLPALARDDVYE